MDILSNVIKLFFGSKTDKDRKQIEPYVRKIKEIYPSIERLSNDELRGRSAALMQKIADFIAQDEAHIVEQKAILDDNPNNKNLSVPGFNYYRELESYQIADYIAIASQHVARSFYKHNYPKDKLFINPYGVDLSMFKPLPNVETKYDVIMVGGWSYQKGCDLIVGALKDTDLKFLHVGAIVDVEFPTLPNFTHIDPVDQTQLINYYNMAKIAVLSSRQEGLAMVQAQAIACNLPFVGSIDSGAEDLRDMVECPEYITIIDKYTIECVKSAIDCGLEKYNQLDGKMYAGCAIEKLTWTAYGKRYAKFLNIVSAKR